MKIAFQQICINPSFPIKQCGFLQQVNPIYQFHDDLHARILSFQTENMELHFVSCDALGFPYEFQKSIQAVLEKKCQKEVHVTISCTHTHFSADVDDPRFQSEVEKKILNAIEYQNYHESDSFAISFQTIPFEGVGKSRVSHHQATVLLQYVTIYENEKPWIHMMIHNVHPTIHHGDTPYFTSEYPGYVIQKLKENYEGEAFTFFQGAAGDVSTRFTRPSQDYAGVIELGNHLVCQIEEMMKEEPTRYPLNEITYQSTFLKLQHEIKKIDVSQLPKDISERERSEIETGKKMCAYIEQHPERLRTAYMISGAKIGPFHFVFLPNEAFSSYIQCIPTENTALVCYSNGYAPYMTGIDENLITYESFTDTLTDETKKEYMEKIRQMAKV